MGFFSDCAFTLSRELAVCTANCIAETCVGTDCMIVQCSRVGVHTTYKIYRKNDSMGTTRNATVNQVYLGLKGKHIIVITLRECEIHSIPIQI